MPTNTSNKLSDLVTAPSRQASRSSKTIQVAPFVVQQPQGALTATLGLKRRNQAYIHPSWLAKALAGDRQCLFSLHLQANFYIPKGESDFDLEGYKLKHQAVLMQYVDVLEGEGYTVHTEDTNSFRVTTKTGAVISAKPDVVAIQEDEVLVVDIKTGKPRASDIAQIKLYMAMLPLAGCHSICEIPAGKLVYQDDTFDIASTEITTKFKQQVSGLIGGIMTKKAPPATPSARECCWCPLSHICPYKVDTVAEGTADWL